MMRLLIDKRAVTKMMEEKHQIRQDDGMEKLSLKGKAACVKKLLEAKADERQIMLKLRKK